MPKNIGLTFARKSECFISKENKKRPPMKKDALLKKCKELKKTFDEKRGTPKNRKGVERPPIKKQTPLKNARSLKDLR
jgi:hypothetical protein